jgi:hypothetical protein
MTARRYAFVGADGSIQELSMIDDEAGGKYMSAEEWAAARGYTAAIPCEYIGALRAAEVGDTCVSRGGRTIDQERTRKGGRRVLDGADFTLTKKA